MSPSKTPYSGPCPERSKFKKDHDVDWCRYNMYIEWTNRDDKHEATITRHQAVVTTARTYLARIERAGGTPRAEMSNDLTAAENGIKKEKDRQKQTLQDALQAFKTLHPGAKYENTRAKIEEAIESYGKELEMIKPQKAK